MKKQKRGFTLIEVVLFLAVTTALFVGIAAGVQGSIFQQRYTDSVQNFAEFLRSVYSQVANVQNESTGRSDKAIYGKVITFGAQEVDAGTGRTRGNVIKTYNLIGDVERTQSSGDVAADMKDAAGNVTGSRCVDNGTVIGKLQCLRANVFIDKQVGGITRYEPVGFVEDYTVRWGAEVQTTEGWETAGNKYQIYEGIVIIAHSPSSGNVSTYVWADRDQLGTSDQPTTIRGVIKKIENCATDNDVNCGDGDPFNTNRIEKDVYEGSILKSENFQAIDIDFCVNPNGYDFSTIRRDIRLSSGAHNASAVDVLTEDRVSGDEDSGDKMAHNRCRY